MLGPGQLLGRERQHRLDGGSSGEVDQFVQSHLGLSDQLNQRQEQLPVLTEEFGELLAVRLVDDLVISLTHGYSFPKKLNKSLA
jgi:hypothetical protein